MREYRLLGVHWPYSNRIESFLRPPVASDYGCLDAVGVDVHARLAFAVARFALKPLVDQPKLLVGGGERKAIAEWLPLVGTGKNDLYRAGRRHRLAPPKPIGATSSLQNRRDQLLRSRLQQCDRLDQIGLAGAVGTNQYVEWLELQLLPVRAERKYVPQFDSLDEHALWPQPIRSRPSSSR